MSTIRTNTLQNAAGSLSVPVDTVVQGSAKAWVNFNGTTSPGTIRTSFNVSSVTKNGTGDYTINFTNALTDGNYSAAGQSQGIVLFQGTSSTTAYRVTTYNFSGTLTDYTTVGVSIFR